VTGGAPLNLPGVERAPMVGPRTKEKILMTLENAIRCLAGSLVLIGLVLGFTVSPWFFILVGFVGVNLIQSSFTHFCPAEMIFKRFGVGCPAETKSAR